MRGMSATSPLGKTDTLRGRPDCWSALVWLLALTAVCGIVDYFALPDGSVWFGLPLDGHEMFRPEWLVVGTLVALPLFRLARASILLGLLGLFLCAGEMFTIVDNARERFDYNIDTYGTGPAFPSLFYALAALQTVVFVVAASYGLRRRWADRRWERMMRRTAAAESRPPARPATRPTQVAD